VRFFVLSWLFVAVLVGYSGILRTTQLPMSALGGAITLGFLATIAISRYYRARATAAGVRALIAALAISAVAVVVIMTMAPVVDYAVLPHSLLPTFFLPLIVVTLVLTSVWLVRFLHRRRSSRKNTDEQEHS
jgi:hypothetical protein